MLRKIDDLEALKKKDERLEIISKCFAEKKRKLKSKKITNQEFLKLSEELEDLNYEYNLEIRERNKIVEKVYGGVR